MEHFRVFVWTLEVVVVVVVFSKFRDRYLEAAGNCWVFMYGDGGVKRFFGFICVVDVKKL